MGREKKKSGLPVWDMMSDLLRLFSSIGPRTKARISGAGSMPKRFIRYPARPKTIVARTSLTLFFSAYAPSMMNMMISGERIP